MAIKRRFTAEPKIIAEDDETITVDTGPVDFEDENGNPVTLQEAEVIVRRKLNPTTDEPEFHMARLEAFCNGNLGIQPHPKDVDTARLLAGVQYVQNVGDDFERIETFYRSRIRSPLTAIRAFMVLAEGGPKKANDDTGTANPLWLFREGRNPFYGKFRSDEDDDADTE